MQQQSAVPLPQDPSHLPSPLLSSPAAANSPRAARSNGMAMSRAAAAVGQRQCGPLLPVARSMASWFGHVEPAAKDPILGVTEAFLADPSPDKVNVGILAHARGNGMAIPTLYDARWPAWFIPDLQAAGVLEYRQGKVRHRASANRVDLVDEAGVVVDSRACRAGKIFVPCTAVHFPCHVACLGKPCGYAGWPSSSGAHGDGARADAITAATVVGGYALLLPRLETPTSPTTRDSISPNSSEQGCGGDGGSGEGEAEAVREGRCSQACAASRDLFLVRGQGRDEGGSSSCSRFADRGGGGPVWEGEAQACVGGSPLSDGSGGFAGPERAQKWAAFISISTMPLAPAMRATAMREGEAVLALPAPGSVHASITISEEATAPRAPRLPRMMEAEPRRSPRFAPAPTARRSARLANRQN